MTTTQFERKTLQEIASYAIDRLNDGIGVNVYPSDLHHELFNTDWYIIGRYQAEQWLIANTGVFNAIGTIQEYEKEQFGEICTDLSEPENIVNMLVYIIGEEVLSSSQTYNDRYNDRLTAEDIAQIADEIKHEYDI